MKAKRKPRPITARNACDRMFSQIVRSRGMCQYRNDWSFCTATDTLQCAHIISRKYAWTRTDERNALCLCAKHHMHFHANPDEWMDFINWTIGRNEYARLKAKAHATVGQRFDWFAERERLKRIHAEVFA